MPKQLHDIQSDVKEGEKLQKFLTLWDKISVFLAHTQTQKLDIVWQHLLFCFSIKKKERKNLHFKLQPTGSLEPAIAYPSYATQISWKLTEIGGCPRRQSQPLADVFTDWMGWNKTLNNPSPSYPWHITGLSSAISLRWKYKEGI